MREKKWSKSVAQKYLWYVMLAGILAVLNVPWQGTLTAKAASTEINIINFLDEHFRAYVTENFDTDGDGSLSDGEKASVVNINVSENSITSMKGIEYFENLQELECSSNQLTSLDVSKNLSLKVLYCSGNQLRSLDLSKNTALTTLYCSGNQLERLDVRNSVSLTKLICYSNRLTSLDVSKNLSLEVLFCAGNQLRSLDLSKNTALESFWCNNNQLSNLDLSKNTALAVFKYRGNQFFNDTAYFDTADLKGFDLSKTSEWTNAAIFGTVVTAVDVSSPVTYTYDCGNNHSATFTFIPVEGNIYPVIFNANGGKCSSSSIGVTYGGTYGTLPIPIQEGFIFAGWYTDASGGSQVTDNMAVSTRSAQTLYAHWREDKETPSTETSSVGTQQPHSGGSSSGNISESTKAEKEPVAIAKANNKKTVKSSIIILKSASGVTEADRYMVLGNIKAGKKGFTLRLNTEGVKKLTYKSANKKVATINKKGAVKIKGIGKTTITVTATVSSTGKRITKKYTLTVNPDKTTLKSVKSPSEGKVAISWKKNRSGQGYQFSYSTSKNFRKETKSFNVQENSITTVSVTGMMRKTTYYVRVRSYKSVSGKPYYGAWSKTKTVKVK